MIGVVVGGGDGIDKPEALGLNHALTDAGVGLVSRCILQGKGVGEVGIEKDMTAMPLEQKTRLSEPPEAEEVVVDVARGLNIGKESIVLEKGFLHELRRDRY